MTSYTTSPAYRSEGNWWACDVLRQVEGDTPRKTVTVFALDAKRAAAGAARLVRIATGKEEAT